MAVEPEEKDGAERKQKLQREHKLPGGADMMTLICCHCIPTAVTAIKGTQEGHNFTVYRIRMSIIFPVCIIAHAGILELCFLCVLLDSSVDAME